MSINSLDYFTIINIASRLDLQSFYNFSRSSKTFKEVCQKIDCKKIWGKETYDIFIDVIIDSVVNCEAKMSNNLFLIEASLNVIQYVNSIINNITREFTMFQHSKEVIQFILSLPEILLKLNYEDTLVLCVGPVRKYSDGLKEFSCSENTFSETRYLFVGENDFESNNEKRKRIKNCTYLKIPKDKISIEVLLKDKEFRDFCSIVRKVTKVKDISDELIAKVIQIIFGIYSSMAYPLSTPRSFIKEKKLSLLIKQLLDIRNTNIKYILSRNTLLKQLVNNVLIISKVTSRSSFDKLIEQYIYFVKHFHIFCLSDKEKRTDLSEEERIDLDEGVDLSEECRYELVSRKKYIKFLFKSLSCIEEKNDYENQKYEHKYLLHGPHDEVELLYWWDKEWNIKYLINGVTIDTNTIIYDDIKLQKIIEIINIYLIKNLHQNKMERKLILKTIFCLRLLETFLYVHGRYASYGNYYHTAIVNLQSISKQRKSKRIAERNTERI